jgi:hypothetical protein
MTKILITIASCILFFIDGAAQGLPTGGSLCCNPASQQEIKIKGYKEIAASTSSSSENTSYSIELGISTDSENVVRTTIKNGDEKGILGCLYLGKGTMTYGFSYVTSTALAFNGIILFYSFQKIDFTDYKFFERLLEMSDSEMEKIGVKKMELNFK